MKKTARTQSFFFPHLLTFKHFLVEKEKTKSKGPKRGITIISLLLLLLPPVIINYYYYFCFVFVWLLFGSQNLISRNIYNIFFNIPPPLLIGEHKINNKKIAKGNWRKNTTTINNDDNKERISISWKSWLFFFFFLFLNWILGFLRRKKSSIEGGGFVP